MTHDLRKQLNLKLMQPTLEMEQSYHEYIDEWEKEGDGIHPHSINPLGRDYKIWLEATQAIQKQETCPPHLVTADTYFLINDAGRMLGAINIRHRLNDYLFNIGGHIGYGVRPSERRKGYATLMLRLAVEKCRELGLEKVLIICNKENHASARTIIANGGVLENEVPDGDRVMQRYWITLWPMAGEGNTSDQHSPCETGNCKDSGREAPHWVLRHCVEPGDAKYVTHLHGILYAEEYGYNQTFETYVANGLAEFTQSFNPDKDRLWLAEINGQIVGSIAIKGHSRDEAQLRWFLVHPDYRGLGLGRELMKQALSYCKEHKYKTIFLWTTTELKAARHLYTGAGFDKIEEKTHEIWGKRVTEERYELHV